MNYKEKLAKLGVFVPNVLLPNKNIDYSKYAVLACDQYAAQPEYWQRVKEYVGDSPSALNMILPEAWLLEGDRDYAARDEAMKKYLSDGTLCDMGEAMIFTRRKTPDGTRRGLIAAFDMEQYEFEPGHENLIKVTEMTDITRVKPRVEIRRKAALELPHILMLVIDRNNKLMSMLDSEYEHMEKVYDFDLMEGGGHLEGAKVKTPEMLQKVADILDELFVENGSTFSFAVGDGNHSMATAKCYWNEIKQTLSSEEQKNHPARYCLAEIINLYDPAMPYECMNRLLSGVSDRSAALAEMGVSLSALPSLQELQPILDKYLANHPEVSLEYVHDADTCERLGKAEGCIAFTYRSFDRDSVYEMVRTGREFVRKSFSLGHPYEKRYYLEARKIVK